MKKSTAAVIITVALLCTLTLTACQTTSTAATNTPSNTTAVGAGGITTGTLKDGVFTVGGYALTVPKGWTQDAKNTNVITNDTTKASITLAALPLPAGMTFDSYVAAAVEGIKNVTGKTELATEETQLGILKGKSISYNLLVDMKQYFLQDDKTVALLTVQYGVGDDPAAAENVVNTFRVLAVAAPDGKGKLTAMGYTLTLADGWTWKDEYGKVFSPNNAVLSFRVQTLAAGQSVDDYIDNVFMKQLKDSKHPDAPLPSSADATAVKAGKFDAKKLALTVVDFSQNTYFVVDGKTLVVIALQNPQDAEKAAVEQMLASFAKA